MRSPKSFALLAFAAVWVVGCGQTAPRPPAPDAGDPFFPGTNPSQPTCTEGETRECYGGDAATRGVGNCKAGSQTCVNGFWTACDGQVLPQPESCATEADDDCDGEVNEEGADCGCQAGSVRGCYSGPAGTAGVGLCRVGTQTCNANGVGYGPCVGEVLPQAETCNTPADEDCDGLVNEGGEGCVCAPGASEPCYTGPPGTAGVGACREGTRLCNALGTAWGGCDGQTLPQAETCNTPEDDDCDGTANEDGPGCVCQPGAVRGCYTGPAGTAGVGPCKAGVETCNAQGNGYGACVGEVKPLVEDCDTPIDENCDGQTPACQSIIPIIDLRGDANRNGTVELAGTADDANEAQWSAQSGAVFLANIDDDQSACPTSNQTDTQLANCHDAADTVVNGAADAEDLARLRTVPWPDAPQNASATVTLSLPSASAATTPTSVVRLFKRTGPTTWQHYVPGTALSSAELQAGLEFGIEGRDILRDSAVWDGTVDVTFTVNAGTDPSGVPLQGGSDTVRMRQAPVIFRHHLDRAERVYISNVGTSQAGFSPFRTDFLAAATAASVPQPVTQLSTSDRWTQDFFETAYMSMPGPNGAQKVIHVNFRSANHTGSLRAAGRLVYTALRGPDVAGAVSFSTTHENSWDTLNSFGNLETIPPYAKNGVTYTVGKVLRGGTFSSTASGNYFPDPAFDKMVAAQSVQGIHYVDTSWLVVSHVDETLSFVRANTPRGWVMLASAPTLARNMLQQAQAQGHGSTNMFVGKMWSSTVSAQVSINQVLADIDLMNESASAAVEIDSQVQSVASETGLQSSEILPVAGLFERTSGYSVAHEPGMVNGIYLSNTRFGVPVPHGPVINGQDLFRQQFQSVLQPLGITISWIENWDLLHRNLGEVHCGSNTTREVPLNVKWWESGL